MDTACDHPLCFGEATRDIGGEIGLCGQCFAALIGGTPASRERHALARDRRIYRRLRAMVAESPEERRRFDRLARAHIAGRGVPATPGAWLVAAEELTGVLA